MQSFWETEKGRKDKRYEQRKDVYGLSSPSPNGFCSITPCGEDACLLSDFSDDCARKRLSAFTASAEDKEITSR